MKYKILPILVLILCCAACVDIEVNTTIRNNGSGLQRWKLTTTALLGGQLKKQIEKDQFFAKKKATFSEEYREGDYILTVEIPFKKIQELKDNEHDLRLEKSGFFKKSYVYTEVWNRNPQADSGPLKRGPGAIIPPTMKIVVELPGKIVESNADQVQGNRAQWNLELTELTDSKTLRATSSRWDYWIITPVAITLLIGFGSLLFLMILSSRRKNEADITCASCGSRAPKESTFCNHCGTKFGQAG